ncbi:hypothetical protein AB0O34_13455 [Sphaerisporangium sp. NPDC088356]|uniref:hypothetical protein n=1 Tax=Sphaerisporangium sp. NPDC088356 TaxID=3154871 RepID=UPI003415DA63
MQKPRTIRIRWHADHPPRPLGCRWCGHPPYAHDAGSLPHRRHHQWEHPTNAQVRARLDARRRLALSGSFPAPPALRPSARVRPAVRPQLPACASTPPGRRPDIGLPRHQTHRQEAA